MALCADSHQTESRVYRYRWPVESVMNRDRASMHRTELLNPVPVGLRVINGRLSHTHVGQVHPPGVFLQYY